MVLRGKTYLQGSMQMLKVSWILYKTSLQDIWKITFLIFHYKTSLQDIWKITFSNISVIDLFDAGQYSSLRKTNAYSSVRKLAGRSLVRWAWQFWGQKMQQFWGKKLRALSHQNFCQIAYFVTTCMQLACNAIMRDFEEGSVPKAWKTMWGHFPIPTWYRGK